MLSTAVAIVAAVALLSPGFVIVELSEARGARATRSDLALALRAVFYAVVIHLAFGWWTASLARRVGDVDQWRDHVGAISLYVLTVLVVVPIVVGVLISRYVQRAESQYGPLSLLAAGLGAGEARDAFDFAFQHAREEGAWVIIELAGHTFQTPRLVGGRFGAKSSVGQTPSGHDVFLETLYLVKEETENVRELDQESDPPIGLYVPASQIVRIDLVPEVDEPEDVSRSRRRLRLQWPIASSHGEQADGSTDRGRAERPEVAAGTSAEGRLQAGGAPPEEGSSS